jgi:hypothetical protein
MPQQGGQIGGPFGSHVPQQLQQLQQAIYQLLQIGYVQQQHIQQLLQIVPQQLQQIQHLLQIHAYQQQPYQSSQLFNPQSMFATPGFGTPSFGTSGFAGQGFGATPSWLGGSQGTQQQFGQGGFGQGYVM